MLQHRTFLIFSLSLIFFASFSNGNCGHDHGGGKAIPSFAARRESFIQSDRRAGPIRNPNSANLKRSFVSEVENADDLSLAMRDALITQLSSGTQVSGSLTLGAASTLYYITLSGSQGIQVSVEASDSVQVAVGSTQFTQYSGEDGLTPAARTHNFKVLHSCSNQYFIMVRNVGTGSTTFQLTATLVGRAATIGGPEITSSFQAFTGAYVSSHIYTVTPSTECTDFSVQLYSKDYDISSVVIQTACSADFHCDKKMVDENEGANYFTVEVECASAQTYYVIVTPRYVQRGAGNYTLKLVPGIASNACPDCQYGICQAGVCKCQDPYIGANCDQLNTSAIQTFNSLSGSVGPYQTMYASLTIDVGSIGQENLILSLSSVSGYDLTLSMNKDAPPVGKALYWYVAPTPLPIPVIREICNAVAVGTYLIRITNHGPTPHTFVLTQTSMDRTLLGATSISGFIPSTGALVHFRIPAPVPNNLVVTLTGDNQLNGLYLIEGDQCGFDTSYFNYVDADISEGGQRGAFQVSTQCYSEGFNNDIYAVISGANSSYTITVSYDKGDCPSYCSGNGVCMPDGSCACYQGYEGDECTPLFNEVPLNTFLSGTVSNSYYFYFTFTVPAGQTFFIDQQGASKILVGRDPRDFANYYISDNSHSCSSNSGDLAGGQWYGYAKPELLEGQQQYNFRIFALANMNLESGQTYTGTVNGNANVLYQFSLDENQKIHIDVDTDTQNVHAAINPLCVYVSLGNEVDAVGSPTGSGLALDMNTCNGGTYYLIISTSQYSDFPYTVTATISTGELHCPNCCSRAGECQRDGTCSCVASWGGSDCSQPVCKPYNNPFCGIEGSFVMNPTNSQIRDNEFNGQEMYSCSTQQVVSNIDTWASNYLASGIGGECADAMKKLVCDGMFLSCDGTNVKIPCGMDCQEVVDSCSCIPNIAQECSRFLSERNPVLNNQICSDGSPAGNFGGEGPETSGENSGSGQPGSSDGQSTTTGKVNAASSLQVRGLLLFSIAVAFIALFY